MLNKKYVIGQVLDLQMLNIVRIAPYNEVLSSFNDIDLKTICQLENLIFPVACSREQLDYGVWKIIGAKEQNIPISKFPNKQYRINKWIGAKHYDAALVEDFVNSYYALLPWNDWFDPNCLGQFLIDKSTRPSNLIFIKKD